MNGVKEKDIVRLFMLYLFVVGWVIDGSFVSKLMFLVFLGLELKFDVMVKVFVVCVV